MTTALKHACERCGGWIREEQGVCGVCKAKAREWPSHAPIRQLLDDLEERLKAEREKAHADENDDRRQWCRETYRDCDKQISVMRFALEELELEHVGAAS